jgi:uncharacterized protein
MMRSAITPRSSRGPRAAVCFWLGRSSGVLRDGLAPVRIDVQNGEPGRAEQSWPLERAAPTPFYLDPAPAGAIHSVNDGSLTLTAPTTGSAEPTVYAYPRPEWTVGTTVIEHGIPRPVQGLLTFTTPPLEEDLEVTGPIAAVLYVETDQADTEFFIKISEQMAVPRPKEFVMHHLAGEIPPPAQVVTRGWLKASHRAVDPERSTPLRPWHPHTDAEPVTPGQIVRYEIEVWPTSYSTCSARATASASRSATATRWSPTACSTTTTATKPEPTATTTMPSIRPTS